jgi:hypothetical protein
LQHHNEIPIVEIMGSSSMSAVADPDEIRLHKWKVIIHGYDAGLPGS